jgi:hypothetical protein
MKNIIAELKLSLFIFLLSCAGTQTYIDQSKIAEGNYNLEKIIILHLGGIYDNRRLIEDELTYWLNHEGYSASPSYRYLQSQNLPNKVELSAILLENNFDGVLITQLKDIDTRERFENTQQRYNASPTDPVFYNYLDAYKNQYKAGYSFLERTYIVDVELHAVKDEKLIYKSTAETRDLESLDLVVEDFSKTIAKNLKRSNLLKKKG